MSHYKKHTLTGTTDHDLTGLLPLQLLVLDSSASTIQSSGIFASGGTLTATTFYSGATPLSQIFVVPSQLSQYIPLTGTSAPNIVTGNIEFANNNGIEWNGGTENISYNSNTGSVDMNATSGFDFTNGPILSAGTPLIDIINSAITNNSGFSGWTSSTGSNSIIANNGTGNIASSAFSFAGGKNNIASANYSFIGGGYSNSATTKLATIIGGNNNLADDYHSFIGNGYSNSITNQYSVIVGGSRNSAAGRFAAIVNGRLNVIKGTASFIGAGKNNTVLGSYASVVCGISNVAPSDF